MFCVSWGSRLTQDPLQWHWWSQGSAPLVQGIISSPCQRSHLPLILVIPNPISTDLIFTSTSQMNMLNIIIR